MNAPLMPMAKVGRTAIEPIRKIAPEYLECEILLVSGKILGRETFRLESFEGKEGVSEPFEFNLVLHGDTNPHKDTLHFSQLIGRPVNVTVSLPTLDQATGRNVYAKPGEHGTRLPTSVFNGIIAGFAMQEPGVYQATMRPTLWRMTLTNHYRMFAHASVRSVLESLCQEHRIVANFEALSGDDNIAVSRVQDWLQAGESDFEFMRRLMSKAHIFYYFVHQYGEHTLVFSNRASYPGVFEDNRPLRYTWTSEDDLNLHQCDVVAQYSFQQSIGSSGVHGVFTTEEQAANVLDRIASYAVYRADSAQDVGELPFNQYRIYQYGGSNNEVRHYTLASNDALQTGYSQLTGGSFCPLLRVGHQFRMAGMDWVRPELEKAPFVVTSVTHKATLDGEYSNQFQAADASGLITPISVADTQQGALLAKVIAHSPPHAPGSWPYYTPDNFDLQKEEMQDSQGVQNAFRAKGVFVRFSTDADNAAPVWVKITPSIQSIPEIGTMVLVSRANDESELPEIQSIHADGSMTVTPNDWTAHSHVGHSYSTTYGDGKSIRFSLWHWSGGDTKVAANIVETAYDRRGPDGKNPLFRDASYSRGGSYGYSCSEYMELGMLSESWSYGCTYGNAWAKENKSFSATGRSYHESVTGSSNPSLHSTEAQEPDALTAVQASKSLVIGDTWSKSTSQGNTKSITTYHGDVTSNTLHDGKVTSDTKHTGVVTSTTLHEADVIGTNTILTNSTNTSTVLGITTNTNTNNIVNSFSTTTTSYSEETVGTATHKSTTNSRTSTSNTGSVNDTTTTGSVNSTSTTGTSTSTATTGASSQISITGAHSNISVTGASSNISVSGATANINVTGATANIDLLGAGVTLSVRGAVASIDISGPAINIPIILMVM